MSDLAARRDAREVWVSRSHLHAALAGALLLSLTCFGAGFLVGRHQAVAGVQAEERTLTGDVPGRDLLVLLAEVERNAMASASSAVVYPDLLDRRIAPAVPTAEPPAGVLEVTVPAPPVASMFEADAVPAGLLTLEVGVWADERSAQQVRAHLRARGLQAWWWQERVDGQPRIHVAVGGFEDAATAEAQVAAVGEAAQTAPLPVAAPRVVELPVK